MGVHVDWEDENIPAIQLTFGAVWDWDDFRRALNTVNEMCDRVAGNVDVIVDISQSAALPPNTLANFQGCMFHRHPSISQTIVVGANPLFRLFGSILSRTAIVQQLTIYHVQSLEEAFTWLGIERISA